MVLLILAFYLLTALALLAYCGLAAARWLLPAALQRFTLLAAPLFGFCVIAVVSSWLNTTVLSMRAITPLLLAALPVG